MTGDRATTSGDGATVTIEAADTITDELVDAVARLLPQLSSAPTPDRDHLAGIVGHDAISLLIARDAERRIVGMLTLVIFPIPTGVRSWIEDVVVDEQARGLGIATALMTAATERSRAAGARSLDLTSRPTREDANRLYQRLGFVRRETNVYRYSTDT